MSSSNTLPRSQTAVVVTQAGKLRAKGKLPSPGTGGVIRNAPVPSLAHLSQSGRQGEFLIVKTRAVALNPTDWKHLDFLSDVGCLLGCDWAGEVLEVGHSCKDRFAVGHRVCGMTHGGNNTHRAAGAFAQYIIVAGSMTMHIPKNMSFTSASTLGTGIITVGQSLYQSLGLPQPTASCADMTKRQGDARYLLIYGASTATGTLAIQFAKLSGCTVIATASPHNFELCKKYGADHVVDYHDGTRCAAEIRKLTQGSLSLVLDCIADSGTATVCANALAPASGNIPNGVRLTYTGLLPLERFPRPDVTAKSTLAYSASGEAFNLGPEHYPAKPEDKEFAEQWFKTVEDLLSKGLVKTHPVSVEDNGLDGILDGLQLSLIHI